MFNRYFFFASLVLLVTVVTFSQGQEKSKCENVGMKIFDDFIVPDTKPEAVDDVVACRGICKFNRFCKYYTYSHDKMCSLYTKNDFAKEEKGSVSGPKNCPEDKADES